MTLDYRSLPSVDRLLQTLIVDSWTDRIERRVVVDAARAAIDDVRQQLAEGASVPSLAELAAKVNSSLSRLISPSLVKVINATGVVLHTNLGRSPLSKDAVQATMEAASGYTTLEYDLESGERSNRGARLESLLKAITSAEAAIAVNNNASAVLLGLTGLASGRDVIISRGEEVEIGGSFRVPDVMRQSGARLVEVGTTNRTRLADYEEAITSETALLLQVHPSNFRIIGFTESVSTKDLVALGNRYGIPVMDDLGSGALLATEQFGLAHERTVQESIDAGASIVCFSGDKLLGGPQAGILAGKSDVIAKLRTHPLARALRLDKMSIAALEVTLQHYLKGDALTALPVWCMISEPLESLQIRAARIAAAIETVAADVDIKQGLSTVGGGSLPGEVLPTVLVRLRPASADIDGDSWSSEAARRLRTGGTPVVARVEKGAVLLDPRTVPEEDEADLVRAVNAAL